MLSDEKRRDDSVGSRTMRNYADLPFNRESGVKEIQRDAKFESVKYCTALVKTYLHNSDTYPNSFFFFLTMNAAQRGVIVSGDTGE